MTNKNDLRYIDRDDFNGVCGICGKEIPIKNERIEVHIYLQDDGEQINWVHKKYLKRILHPSVPVGF